MKQYRLKQGAIPFFDDKLKTKIKPMPYWEDQKVSSNAIEEVEPVFLTYGKKLSEFSTTQCGWSSDPQESYFDFTIHFSGMTYDDYKKIHSEEKIRIMMTYIQESINSFLDSQNL